MHTDPYYVPPPLSEPDHADRTAPGDNTPDLEPLPLPEVPPKQEQKIFIPISVVRDFGMTFART